MEDLPVSIYLDTETKALRAVLTLGAFALVSIILQLTQVPVWLRKVCRSLDRRDGVHEKTL